MLFTENQIKRIKEIAIYQWDEHHLDLEIMVSAEHTEEFKDIIGRDFFDNESFTIVCEDEYGLSIPQFNCWLTEQYSLDDDEIDELDEIFPVKQ